MFSCSSSLPKNYLIFDENYFTLGCGATTAYGPHFLSFCIYLSVNQFIYTSINIYQFHLQLLAENKLYGFVVIHFTIFEVLLTKIFQFSSVFMFISPFLSSLSYTQFLHSLYFLVISFGLSLSF